MYIELSFGTALREQSLLMLGKGMEEFLDRYQIYLPCFIGLPNFFANS